MGADGGGGTAADVTMRFEASVPSNSAESKRSNSGTDILDIHESVSEYLAQLQAAAPSLHPVPCGSFFTKETTVADLTNCSPGCSSMARDLYESVTQKSLGADAKAYKAFAKSLYAAAKRQLATAEACSVCSVCHHDEEQQQQQQESCEDWALCLLPHLDPRQQIKSFGLPQIVCGRCLGVLRLPTLLKTTAGSVSGCSGALAGTEESLDAALSHFLTVNSNEDGLEEPFRYCHIASNSIKGEKQQEAPKHNSIKGLSEAAKRRGLDIALAAAFSVHVLSKEIQWTLKGPADSLDEVLKGMNSCFASPAATSLPVRKSAAGNGGNLFPVKEEVDDPSQSKAENDKQQRQKQHRKTKKAGKSTNRSDASDVVADKAQMQTQSKRKVASSAVSVFQNQQPKRSLGQHQGQKKVPKKARL